RQAIETLQTIGGRLERNASGEVGALYLQNTDITDTHLALLSHFPHLKTLNLRHCSGLTDAGLKYVGQATQLESLSFSWNGLTDRGMSFLRDLTRLRELGLGGTKITDEGLKHLQHMTELEELDLWLCLGVTGSGLQYLQDLRKLKVVYFA